MTDTRREFIKKATLLTGATGLFSIMPESIKKALAIEADKGSTYLDAEHIVFLMQENRSFDHCYGTLQGVRGFDDPRAMQLPNKNKVWLQTNKDGKTYIPFNLDIKNSKATWMQSLPHSWDNQVNARNKGQMDGWLESKKSGNPEYSKMPLTMGYYNRQDIPFYYALADAFTVCDQSFCSALTGTSSNRAFYWSGTIREEQNENSSAKLYNGDIDYMDISWKTFPERLEEAGVSWKIYQNELSVGVGFEGEEDDWLANFTDNSLEFFKQYNVRLHQAHRNYLPKRLTALEKHINELQKQEQTAKVAKQFADSKTEVERVKKQWPNGLPKNSIS
jgi:phospholipase C